MSYIGFMTHPMMSTPIYLPSSFRVVLYQNCLHFGIHFYVLGNPAAHGSRRGVWKLMDKFRVYIAPYYELDELIPRIHIL
jgi:hypothetical protein